MTTLQAFATLLRIEQFLVLRGVMIHLYNSQQTYWIDSFIPDYIRSYHQPHIKWHPYDWYLNLLLMYQSGSSQDRENSNLDKENFI